jgi:hypothetical protein
MRWFNNKFSFLAILTYIRYSYTPYEAIINLYIILVKKLLNIITNENPNENS